MQASSAPACSARTLPPAAHAHERRTRWVVVLTAAMMVLELVAGALTNSLALMADGWHMATHAGALGLSAFGYWFARTRAQDERYTFGTGKVASLAGYTSALSLVLVALAMLVSAVQRLVSPVSIHFDEALPIAVLGLVVNLVCAWLLHHDDAHGHDHGHGHDDHDDDDHAREHGDAHAAHGHAHDDHGLAHAAHGQAHDAHGREHDDHGHAHDDHGHAHGHAAHAYDHGHARGHAHGHDDHGKAHDHGPADHGHGAVDHNLRAAYLHVVADALTSVLAIGALLAGRYLGWGALDAVSAIVGSFVILRWGVGLCRGSARHLLDANARPAQLRAVRQRLEALGDTRVTDLHIWELSPGRRSAIVQLATSRPLPLPAYREAIRAALPVEHLTVQVEHAEGAPPQAARA